MLNDVTCPWQRLAFRRGIIKKNNANLTENVVIWGHEDRFEVIMSQEESTQKMCTQKKLPDIQQSNYT